MVDAAKLEPDGIQNGKGLAKLVLIAPVKPPERCNILPLIEYSIKPKLELFKGYSPFDKPYIAPPL